LIFLLCDGTGYNFSLTVPAAPVVDNPRCGGVRAGPIEEYPDATEHTGRAPRPIIPPSPVNQPAGSTA
jgi:hypothetical protein